MKKETGFVALAILSLIAVPESPAQVSQADPEVGDDPTFVRESVAFKVVPVFGSNPNNVEVFPDYCTDFQEDPTAQGDCEEPSPYGIEYEEFLDRLGTAFAEGRGGVINFENPIQGPVLQAPDRTGYRAVVEEFLEGSNFEEFEQEVREDMPELGDNDVLIEAVQRQIEAGLELAREQFPDPDVVPVFARTDRGMNDDVENPFLEDLFTKNIIALYGEDFASQLVMRKGPNMRTEGMLATDRQPGATWPQAWINGETFPEVGRSTYSGGAYEPVSGINSFNNGMVDLRFDPRDNIKVIGLAFMAYGNFQYYQGAGGVPQNPNNMRLTVYFSDGTSEELAETSRQSSGNWDVFFGVEAPEGESITGIWCRVIGNNFRTFVAIDDLTFITEPNVPYIVGDTSFTGAEGAEFYTSLDIGQQLDAITVSDLPPGISYDAESGLLRGTFAEAGSYTAQVVLENEVGTNTVDLDFTVEAPLPDGEELDILPVEPATVVLRRELVPVEVETTEDANTVPGDIEFFTRVYRLGDGGERMLTSLDELGLTQVDNRITGKPAAAQQVGEFEIEMYARYELSSAVEIFPLTILAPTVSPNFDANGTTDLAIRKGTEIFAAEAPETGSGFGVGSLTRQLSGLAAGSDLYAVDVNGDIRVDYIEWDAAGGRVVQYVNDPESGWEETVLLEGIDAARAGQVVDVADYNGDGNADLLWVDPSDKAYSVWLLASETIRWAGLTEMENAGDRFLGSADFTGSGREAILWQMPDGAYLIENLTEFQNLGDIDRESVAFTLDAEWQLLELVDMNADGIADIVWENAQTGEVMFWAMNGLDLSEDLVEPMEEGAEEPEVWSGRAGELILPPGFDWSPVVFADLNNDQFADVVLRHRKDGRLGLLRLRGGEAMGTIVEIGSAAETLVAHGDYNGDSVNDLLLAHADGGLRLLTVTGDDSVSGSVYAAGIESAGSDWLVPSAYRNQADLLESPLAWLGRYQFANNRWLNAEKFGWLYWMSAEADAAYFFDPQLGIIWMSGASYPNLFQERNQFWLRFVEGTDNPRMFFNYLFGFEMSENEL